MKLVVRWSADEMIIYNENEFATTPEGVVISGYCGKYYLYESDRTYCVLDDGVKERTKQLLGWHLTEYEEVIKVLKEKYM